MNPNDIQDWASRAGGGADPLAAGDVEGAIEGDELAEEADDVADLRAMADTLQSAHETLEKLMTRVADLGADDKDLKEIVLVLEDAKGKLDKLSDEVEDLKAEAAEADAEDEEDEMEGEDGFDAPPGVDDGGLA